MWVTTDIKLKMIFEGSQTWVLTSILFLISINFSTDSNQSQTWGHTPATQLLAMYSAQSRKSMTISVSVQWNRTPTHRFSPGRSKRITFIVWGFYIEEEIHLPVLQMVIKTYLFFCVRWKLLTVFNFSLYILLTEKKKHLDLYELSNDVCPSLSSHIYKALIQPGHDSLWHNSN